MKKTEKGALRVSEHVVAHQIGEEKYAIWNSLFPSVLIVDGETVEAITTAKLEQFDAADQRWLLRHRILHRHTSDPYVARFFKTADRAIAEIDQAADEFYAQQQPYAGLYITNSGCNLGCSYCVSYAGDEYREAAKRVADKGDERFRIITRLVDQYMQRKVAAGHEFVNFNFNGGEILLRWPLIRDVLRHVRRTYPSTTITCDMNTNATLVTDEVAQELKEFNVKPHISIDGYKEKHDSTRHYHTGGGSFDAVMSGIRTFNKHNPDNPIWDTQGTIENVENFDTQEFLKMEALGFRAARLAPNVLSSVPSKGVRAADWEARLAIETHDKSMALTHSYFERIMKKIGKSPTGFRHNCNGLKGIAPRILTLNVDSMQLSLLCSFSSPAAVAIADLGYDIYNRKLYDAARRYIAGRLDMLRTACAGCDVLGVCQGACVYNGLDVGNKLNAASCAYQRTTWRHAIEYSALGTINSAADGFESGLPTLSAEAGRCNSSIAIAPPHADGAASRVWNLTPVPPTH